MDIFFSNRLQLSQFSFFFAKCINIVVKAYLLYKKKYLGTTKKKKVIFYLNGKILFDNHSCSVALIA